MRRIQRRGTPSPWSLTRVGWTFDLVDGPSVHRPRGELQSIPLLTHSHGSISPLPLPSFGMLFFGMLGGESGVGTKVWKW